VSHSLWIGQSYFVHVVLSVVFLILISLLLYLTVMDIWNRLTLALFPPIPLTLSYITLMQLKPELTMSQ
jgi:hypothetical protein